MPKLGVHLYCLLHFAVNAVIFSGGDAVATGPVRIQRFQQRVGNVAKLHPGADEDAGQIFPRGHGGQHGNGGQAKVVIERAQHPGRVFGEKQDGQQGAQLEAVAGVVLQLMAEGGVREAQLARDPARMAVNQFQQILGNFPLDLINAVQKHGVGGLAHARQIG